MKIVIPDKMYIAEECLRELRSMGAVIAEDTPTDPKEIISRIQGADIVTAKYIDITRAIIDATPTLKYIVSAAAGYDSIDVEYASSRGITVVNCPTHHAAAVAEHTIALLFAVARNIKVANMHIAEAGWDSPLLMGTELAGKRAGLVGYGNIGRPVEKLLRGIDMNTAYVNSQSSSAEVDALIAESDVLIICTQLNGTTRHLLNERRLSSMKKSALLINVSRGAVIEQAALVRALKSGAVRGAGLDVFENEPASGSPTPEIIDLARMSNVIATPHIGYNTGETAKRLGEELISDLRAILSGTPINVVNE